MGIIDGLVGQFLGGGQTDPKSALIQAAIGLVAQQFSGGQAQQSGGAMGAIGGIMSQFLGGGQNQGAASPVAQIAQLLNQNNTQGGDASPLNGLIGLFQNSGMGEQVKSWVGTGQNLPVSGEQIQQALGGDIVQNFAKQANLGTTETANHLAEILPNIINAVTPNGQVPSAGGIDFAALASQFLGQKQA